MIDRKSFLDEPVKNDLGIQDNVQKVKIGQGDDCTTSSLLDFPYFK